MSGVPRIGVRAESQGEPGVTALPNPSPPAPTRRRALPALLLAAAVAACSVYANLSFAVSNSADYRYFPPFRPHVNANDNAHLGGEYFNIARSLVAGQGFAHPFDRPTGPTAWQPPVLPLVLAGLLWGCGGNRRAVMAVVVSFQVQVLIATGLLVLGLARQTGRRPGAWAAAAVFFAGLLCHFRLCFQTTHDGWLVLLAVDGLLAGLCWCQPLHRRRVAAAWGLFGGLCALINPVVGLAWGVSSLVTGLRARAWAGLGMAVLAAGLTLTPWTVRNYLTFGRLIPTKSNLAYELYQSQCLQPGGLLQDTTFSRHPYGRTTPERREYRALGETAYLDRKWQQFCQAVRNGPGDYARRVGERFLGATVWYVPMDRTEASQRPWAYRLGRLSHPLPFLGLLVLLATAVRIPLHRVEWAAIGVYVLYLLPYVAASYYDRYGMPLLGVKALLVLWAAGRLLSLLPTRKAPAAAPPSPARLSGRGASRPIAAWVQ